MFKITLLLSGSLCAMLLHSASESSMSLDYQLKLLEKQVGILNNLLEELRPQPNSQCINYSKCIGYVKGITEVTNTFLETFPEEGRITTPTTGLGYLAGVCGNYQNIAALAQAYVEQEIPLTQAELNNAKNCLQANIEAEEYYIPEEITNFKALISRLEQNR